MRQELERGHVAELAQFDLRIVAAGSGDLADRHQEEEQSCRGEQEGHYDDHRSSSNCHGAHSDSPASGGPGKHLACRHLAPAAWIEGAGPYSGAVGQDRMPAFEEHWRAFDEMIEYTRGLVKDSGTEDLGYVEQGPIGVYDVTPHNLRASAINIIAEQSLIVTVGGFGGRWELDYTDEHRELGRRIIAATVAGRIEERHAFGRSRVSVTLDDGTIKRATGYDGCGSLFIPQPGWTRWGERTSFEPFQI